MKVVTPEISWHEREPIYSIDVQPCSTSGTDNVVQRLATGGVDRIVRLWKIKIVEGRGEIEFLANLRRHTATVNACRFSPDGKLLATAGDDAVILLWKLSDVPTTSNNIFQDEDADNKETWVIHKSLRGHLGDIYDLCWSPDCRFLVSGSIDNSAIVWDIQKDQKAAIFNEHKSYVQGVAWDPLGEYVATLSADRSCRIYSMATKNCIHNVSKMVPPNANKESSETKPKSVRLFHDDTLRSFFRRLAFSPDGQLLIAPAGCVDDGEKQISSTFVFTRGSFTKPASYLPSPHKATVAVRVCPCLFELRKVTKKEDADSAIESEKEWEKYSTVFCLPYRVVFAVATEDSVLMYDSQQTMPFAFLSNIHYHQLSDISWSSDGHILVVSSTDGYCSVVTFDEGELGVLYTPKPAPSTSSATTQPDKGVGEPSPKPQPETSIVTVPLVSQEHVDIDAAENTKLSLAPPADNTTEVQLTSNMQNIDIKASDYASDANNSAVKPSEGADDAPKQPKRIQFKTISLLNPKPQ